MMTVARSHHSKSLTRPASGVRVCEYERTKQMFIHTSGGVIMRQRTIGFAIGCFLLLVSALPASAQLWDFPDYAVPSANMGPSTFIAGTYGRGLNDASGKLDAYGAIVGRTGEAASFMGGLGIVTSPGDDEITVGGAVGVDLVKGESATIAFNGGIGWMSPGDATLLRFPLGIAIKGFAQSPEATIAPWVMPRINITRVSFSGSSSTETDFGASAGVGFTFPNGFGIHTALDLLLSDSEVWLFGIGVF